MVTSLGLFLFSLFAVCLVSHCGLPTGRVACQFNIKDFKFSQAFLTHRVGS